MARRTLTQAQKKRVAAAHAWRCAACDVLLPATFEVDHVVPLWQGGADAVDNCQPLCPNCHAEKTQTEGIIRARGAARGLDCRRCGVTVSPYFVHACSRMCDAS